MPQSLLQQEWEGSKPVRERELLRYIGREHGMIWYVRGVGKPVFWRNGEKIIEGKKRHFYFQK